MIEPDTAYSWDEAKSIEPESMEAAICMETLRMLGQLLR